MHYACQVSLRAVGPPFFYHTSPVQAVTISLTDSSLALVMRYDLQNPKVLVSLLCVTRTVEHNYTVGDGHLRYLCKGNPGPFSGLLPMPFLYLSTWPYTEVINFKLSKAQ